MMSGPEFASIAAAVLGCSWSPVTVSIATVTPLASPHSAAWRLNSASACLTKLVHCSSRIEAPLRALGMTAAGLELDWGPQEMIISGKAMVATATPAVCRNFRRDQPDLAFLLPCAMAGTPLLVKGRPGEPNSNSGSGCRLMYLAELRGRTEPIRVGVVGIGRMGRGRCGPGR